jgi:type VI secretion system protein ImpC
MAQRMEFELRSRLGGDTPARHNGMPSMRLLLCGDFSGRAGRTAMGLVGTTPLAERSALRVDSDNFDAVMARLKPAVQLVIGGDTASMAFGSLDDFHPDALFDRLELFTRLRSLRRRLLDPASFEQASSELLGTDGESDTASLQRLMGGPARTAAAAAAPASQPPATGIDALIQRIVAPHIVPSHGARQATLVQAVDMAISEQMRALLHAAPFQALEAAWRSVHLLVSRLELDETLQLHLFDVTRAELDATAAEQDLERTGLWQALVERQRDASGGPGWSMLVALEAFGASQADVATLASLAALSGAAGAPLVATAAPSLLGCNAMPLPSDCHTWPGLDADSQQRWQALRRSTLAPWIGLTAPRLLLRLPYGKGKDPITAFAFEEFVGTPAHETFLWGHAGVPLALLIGRGFSASGWAFEPDDEREIDDLPAFTILSDGEMELQACAEQYLGEQSAQALLEAGLMPLLSHKNRNAVTLMRFQSLAEPTAALAFAGQAA